MALLYKNGRFQFSRLESLLLQASRAPGRSALSRADADASPRGSGLELLLSPGVAFVRASDDTRNHIVSTPWLHHVVPSFGGHEVHVVNSQTATFPCCRQVRDLLLEELAKGIDSAWRLAVNDVLAASRKRLKETLAVRSHCIAAVPSTPACRTSVLDGPSLGSES